MRLQIPSPANALVAGVASLVCTLTSAAPADDPSTLISGSTLHATGQAGNIDAEATAGSSSAKGIGARLAGFSIGAGAGKTTDAGSARAAAGLIRVTRARVVGSTITATGQMTNVRVRNADVVVGAVLLGDDSQ